MQTARRKATGPRVAKACDTCRRRKERCDGNVPECGPCVARGRTCLYMRQSKKRGLREGWLHSLEKVLALILTCCPDVEATVLAALSTGIADPFENNFGARWSDETHDHGFLQCWRQSPLASRLRSLQITLDSLPRSKLSRWIEGEEDRQMNRFAGSILPPTPAANSSGDAEGALFNALAAQDSNSADQIGAQNMVSLPPDALQLVDEHFTHTNTWLPIIAKDQMYRIYYGVGSDALDARSDRSAALLLAVLYYAQLQRSSARNHDPNANDRHLEPQDDLLRVAHLLIAKKHESVKMSDAQTFLILALTRIHRCEWLAASLMLAQASRIASMLGHGIPEVQNDSEDMTRLPHIRRACFCLDGILSAALKVPPLYNSLKSATITDIPVDGLEEWSPGQQSTNRCANPIPTRPIKALSTFNHLGHAVQIFNDACVCTDAVAGTEGTTTTPERTMRALVQLRGIMPSDNETMMAHECTVKLLCFSTHLVLEARSSTKEKMGMPFANNNTNTLIQKLHDYCAWVENMTELCTHPSLSPIWPLLMKVVCDVWKEQSFDATPEDSTSAWRSLLRASEKLSKLATSPALDTLCVDVRSRLPSSTPLDATLTSAQDQEMDDNQQFNGQNASIQNHETVETSTLNALSVPFNFEIGEASLSAGISAAVGSSGSVRAGDKESDIGSTAYDIMAMDALQWDNSYQEGLQNLGFAEDLTFGEDATSDMAQFLASLRTPFSL